MSTLPKGGWILKHLVIIRFNYPETNKYYDLRHRILREICLGSLEKQTNKNFEILIASNETFQGYKTIPLGDDVGRLGINKDTIRSFVAEHYPERPLITTRIDYDDAALPTYIDTIQRHVAGDGDYVIDVHSYTANIGTGSFFAHYRKNHLGSMFLSLVEQGEEIKTALYFLHFRISQHYPIRKSKAPHCIYFIHPISFYGSRYLKDPRYNRGHERIPDECKPYVEKWNEIVREIEK